MTVGYLCNRIVTVIHKDESVLEAAKLMREQHVGDVIVVEPVGDNNRPIGILTDRDIVLEFIAKELDLNEFTVGDAIGDTLVTLPESMSLVDAIAEMRTHAVRRAPVVDEQGLLVGIVTVDDIISILAEEMKDLSALVRKGRRIEQMRRD